MQAFFNLKNMFLFQIIEKSLNPTNLHVPQLSHNAKLIPTMYLAIFNMAGICDTGDNPTIYLFVWESF